MKKAVLDFVPILALKVHIINIKSIMLSSMILFPSNFILVAFKINCITSKSGLRFPD